MYRHVRRSVLRHRAASDALNLLPPSRHWSALGCFVTDRVGPRTNPVDSSGTTLGLSTGRAQTLKLFIFLRHPKTKLPTCLQAL